MLDRDILEHMRNVHKKDDDNPIAAAVISQTQLLYKKMERLQAVLEKILDRLEKND